MIEISVKTLDAKKDANTYQFEVDENISILDFKEHIAEKVNIPSGDQRIIYCGKVLTNERRLLDFDLAAKTVHLVQRVPQSLPDNQSRPQPDQSSAQHTFEHPNQQPPNPNQPQIPMTNPFRPDNSYLLGAFTFPSGTFNTGNFQQVVQDFVVANLGAYANHAQVSSTASDDGASVNININLLNQQPLPTGIQVNIRVDQVPRPGVAPIPVDINFQSAPRVTPNDSSNVTPSESSNPSPQPPQDTNDNNKPA